MGKAFLIAIGFLTVLIADGWCQPPPPSGAGETLKHSQDTMEYYQLQHKLQKGKRQLNETIEDPEESPGKQKKIELNDGKDHVIRYFDEAGTESDK